MRFQIFLSIMAFLLITIMSGASQTSDKPTTINLMINAGVPESATEEQANAEELNIENIYQSIGTRNLPATIFSTQDLAKTRVRLILARIGVESKIELAMSGNHSGEKLSTIPYGAQFWMLDATKKAVENSKICGRNEIVVKGFMPQSFDQNQDSYKVLDDLGIQYDTGFQAGILYAPGHEKDVWPYPIDGHKFYAVPISTYTLSSQKIVLQDSYFKDNGLDATQWYDALIGKFDEIQGKDEPLVISLTASVSGSGAFLDALNKYMDYAVSNKASFVTTSQLVDMAKAGVSDISTLPTNIIASEGCATCDQSKSNTTISVINTTPSASSDAEAAEK
jgi:hypothetical protein